MSFLRKVNEVTQVEEPITVTEQPAMKPGPKLTTTTTTTKTSSNSGSTNDPASPFLSAEFVRDLRKRWDGIQAAFVDEPRDAVEQADELVASAIKQLTESFSEARSNVEGQTHGDQVNTEDLRIAMKKYRSLFQKLAAV